MSLTENNDDWLIKKLDKLAESARDYEERAFFYSMSLTALQQAKRIEQAQGELDGRLWNPSQW
ncbi:hypothetical protein [Liquorilactobacillus capillatus]|uniref:Uncharacterized protein n=1 Tax=Liquorilactobacillus capillatus DSM 19910 TaxID=1423731 RepID=A0A0R1MEE2_9LACO|nr:hypothetical protein [Liquorilactobacillus capillatus]KRL02683.1 hypothetical protein FC81_GL000570 [Liquorilactobacillus capillatus DSM 19910]